MAVTKKILSPAKDSKPTQNSSDALRLIMSDKEMKGDIYNDIVPQGKLISTGSLILDSVVKIRSGQVVRLVAKSPEAGKTSEAFVLAENYMKTMENAKTVFFKAEGRLSEEMKRRVGLKFVDKIEDWDYGTVFVMSCNVFETVARTLLNVIKSAFESGENICGIIDSLDGLILKADLDKGFDGNPKVAGVPLLTKLLFRQLALPVAHYDALLLVTGQYAAEIKLDPYAPNIPRQASSSGGSSIGHQSDHVLEFQPRYNGDLILEKEKEKPDPNTNKILGVYAKVTIRKSANDNSGITVSYPVKKGVVGPAQWKSKEVADMMLAYEMISRSGAWFTFCDSVREEVLAEGLDLQEKIQGINGVYTYIEENKPILDFFHKKIKELISCE